MYRKQFEINRSFPRKVYLLLITLTFLTNIAIQPYQLSLQGKSYVPEMLSQLAWTVLLNTIINSIFAGLGLYLATRIGLGMPFIEGLHSSSERWPKFRNILITSIITGVLISALVICIDQLIFKDLVNQEVIKQGFDPTSQETIKTEWWQPFLGSFYGGITEEIQLRLFVLTLVAWISSRVRRDAEGRPSVGVLWLATILSALIFGVGHIPMLSANLSSLGLSLTPILVVSTIINNGIGGIILGWLYWSRGLESAVIAHFTADIVIHILIPAIVLMFST